jgi:hypothetical protein
MVLVVIAMVLASLFGTPYNDDVKRIKSER